MSLTAEGCAGGFAGFRLCPSAMVSVVIEAGKDDEGLARTLASLVPAAVEGVVREVIVCGAGATGEIRRVAEHAGCHYVAEGGVAAAIARARSEWLLLVEPGARMVDGWTESAVAHMARLAMPARFTRSRSTRASLLGRLFRENRALADGLLITSRQAGGLARTAKGAEAVARGLAMKRLEGEILPAR